MQLGLAGQRNLAAMRALFRRDDVRAEMRQHQFGVIAAGFLLDHGGDSRRGQTCQQHRRLDLCRRHRRTVDDRQRIARALQRHRQPSAVRARRDTGAHQFQRIENPAHRPPAQGRIAVESRRNRTSRHRTHGEAASGAAVAEIQRRIRRFEAADADAADRPAPFSGALDLCPQCRHGLGGIENVLAFQKPRNPGLSHRQRAQNQGPVGD